MQYTNITDLQWANAEHTVLNCIVDIEGLGPVPFSAVAEGDYAHTHEIFARAVAGEFGPIVDYQPPAAPTAEELAAAARLKRDDLLKQSDWTQLPDVPQTTKNTWAAYRQALRDLTSQAGFPTNVAWPVAPN